MAPPSTAVAKQRGNDDFMVEGYDLIGEPLNLKRAGQSWFMGAYEHEPAASTIGALVLGATPWLAAYLTRDQERVTIVDHSRAMLDLCARTMGLQSAVIHRSPIATIQADWTDLPNQPDASAVAVGDNAFSFLAFPDGWANLCEQLARRMTTGGRVLARICSVPATHRTYPVDELIDRALAAETVNCTALRTALLFSCWDPRTGSIDTELALQRFERNRHAFDRVLERLDPGSPNDLITVAKYRGAGATYYAPPLGDALSLFNQWFTVTSVHFGPYEMSDYFPLICASSR